MATAARAARVDRARMVGQGSRTVERAEPRRALVSGRMSHHRDPVTAPGAPDAVGPYSHAVRSGGLLFCSGQIAARPRDRQARRGLDRRPDAPLPGEPARSSAQRPAPSCPTRSASAIYVTDMGTFPEVNEAYGSFFGDGPAGAQHDRRRRAAAGRRGRDRRHRRAAELAAARRWPPRPPARPSPPRTSSARAHAIADVAKRTPVLPSLTLTQRAGGEVALKAENLQRTGLVQDPRRPEQARRARRRAARRGSPAAARATTRGRWPRRRARAACRARSSCRSRRRCPRPRAARTLGAVVHRGGTSVEECVAAAQGARRARRAWPSCTRSTTPTSSPARARSGSSCSTTSPTWRRSSCPSAAAGWRAASPSR